jgi:hypothetical protein
MTTNGRGLVIVTGASSGIGEAIALHLREGGFSVLAGLVNNAEILRGGPLEFVPIDTLGANRYARTPASFVHRMGASTHDICSPGRNTRGRPLGTTETRLRLDTPVRVLPGGGWECPSG